MPGTSDETKFNETLKRLLKTPPKPHKPKPNDKSDDKEPPKERGS